MVIANEVVVALVVVAFAAISPPVKVLSAEKVLTSERSVEEAAVMLILEVPSNVTLLIVRPVWSAVAVEALPVRLPIMPPVALSTPLIVVEPVTASAVVVAPIAVSPPLNERAVVVAFKGNGYANVLAAVR